MKRPKLLVTGLTGCWGDKLSILNFEHELHILSELFEIVSWPMAMTGDADGQVDVALVEGSVCTVENLATLRRVRERAGKLVAIGNCATWGGVQCLGTREDDLETLMREVYGKPAGYFDNLVPAPLREYVRVDLDILGCPVEPEDMLDKLTALLKGIPPTRRIFPVCVQCKYRENACLLLEGKPCLGPITMGGCNARHPSRGIPCVGCRGPMPDGESRIEAYVTILRDHGFPEDFIRDKLAPFFGVFEQLRESVDNG
jgi:sulfhydrogenase subunit delta